MRLISNLQTLQERLGASLTGGLLTYAVLLAAGAEGAGLDAWKLENTKARASLPLYKTIPAAKNNDLTPAKDPDPSPAFPSGDWHRSHGGHGNQRFSPLSQINRDNVVRLERAWTYHSKDGKGNIQCNPIVVDGTIYAPTVGGAIVAIDGTTGKERWRFQCEVQPAFRGLTYWDKIPDQAPRLLFNAGDWLYSLDAGSGLPTEAFGNQGRI